MQEGGVKITLIIVLQSQIVVKMLIAVEEL